MPIKYTRTLDNHKEWSNQVKTLEKQQSELRASVSRQYPNRHAINILLSRMGGLMTELKSQLDGDYHTLITESQFQELGNIYYAKEPVAETTRRNRGPGIFIGGRPHGD